jgi:hypothetical protein
MRWRIVLALLAGSPIAASGNDPAGTVMLQVEVGGSAPVSGAPGANVLCDDPEVVAPDYAGDDGGFVLRALKTGSTLCGVWLPGQEPGGLYRVVVSAKADGDVRATGATDAGSTNGMDAGTDAGSR